jgi:uncharacterized protein (TIGR03083 family)
VTNSVEIPIKVVDLFPRLHKKLLTLLQSLTAEQWNAQVSPKWRVKDVAAHLLDGYLRRLSMGRDGYFGENFEGASYEELVGYLNGLNAAWVSAFRRVSPAALIELLKGSGTPLWRYFASLDPQGKSLFPVAWAGEEESENWFDLAREYTESWHHQQQIRDAVGQPGIMGREFYYPVLDTFMRAFPVAYKDVEAEPGTVITVTVKGRTGGDWNLVKDGSWELAPGSEGKVNAEIIIPSEIAWKLFTKGLKAEQMAEIKVKGNRSLAEPLSRVTAIMG